jgi:mono/diheme cytochrome c family protein
MQAAAVAGALTTVGVGLAWADAAKESSAKPVKKPRTGAELYAINCARCHVERYAAERTDAQWKTIMLHMRTRTPLTAQDSKKILEYLKETN